MLGHSMRLAELAGRRVAIWGGGREGRAALAALRRRVPSLRSTVFCTPDEAKTLGDVEAITVPPDAASLRRFDVVIKSPGISAYTPALVEAAAAGVRIMSGTALWFAEHPEARVIAVTGTKGKSTTTALIAHLLRGLGRRVALAGNIGLPLLDLLDPPLLPDWWVIELSSFQTREAGRVDVGVVNNLYDEHLDWHGSRERYIIDKLALVEQAQIFVANGLQSELIGRTAAHPHRIVFGTTDAWHVADGVIRRGVERVFDVANLPVSGMHNALNVCAALAAVDAACEPAVAAATAIATFRPLPHRLQTLGERDGLTWINDSIATTPAATLEALRTLTGHEVGVLVGGFDRGVDWTSFAHAVRTTPPASVVAIGANGLRIADLLERDGVPPFALERVASLADAVTAARRSVPIGGVVLLSPGAPSFDAFRDYAERGRAFAALAGFDPAAITGIEGLGIA